VSLYRENEPWESADSPSQGRSIKAKGEPREYGADEALRVWLRNEPNEWRSAKEGWGKC